MDLLAQCQKWHEQGEFLKIIESLEAIESTDRNSAMICELVVKLKTHCTKNTNQLASKRMLTAQLIG